MNILHITPHLGGGVGTVIMDWMSRVDDNHSILCLDYINAKAADSIKQVVSCSHARSWQERVIAEADIILIHYWDHPMLADLLSQPLPDCRLAFWCHKHYDVSGKAVSYPDRFIDTSPIQGHGKHIWSTVDISRFLTIQPKKHDGFNVGYAGTIHYKKIHPKFFKMCKSIIGSIPDVRFIMIGEPAIPSSSIPIELVDRINFTGKVDDIASYLSEMDCFGYPLRSDHYGTCEQVLGEAMAAGVVPVVMDNPAERLIVRDRWSGLVARDEEDYVRCITQLYYSTPTGKRDGSRCARLRATQLYSLDTMISQWNEVFESMMLQPKKRREPLCV